jgi:hypothetical protein
VTGPRTDGEHGDPATSNRDHGEILLRAYSDADAASVAAALTGRSWRVLTVRDTPTLVAQAQTRDVALLLLIGASNRDAAALADRIARIPPPRGLVPVIALASEAPLPSDAELRDRIATTPRRGTAPPDPIARLSPLFGAAGIAALMQDFRARLDALLAATDPCTVGEGLTIAAIAHRLAGLSGTLDFPLLADAWRDVERDGPARLPNAWRETRIAHAVLTLLLDRRTDAVVTTIS